MSASSANPNHPVHPINAAPCEALDQRWVHVHQKAAQIAAMADLAPEPLEEANSRFDGALSVSGNYAQDTAARALEDTELLLEVGLRALREVAARGQSTHAPALALWREFYHAREAVLGILQPAAA